MWQISQTGLGILKMCILGHNKDGDTQDRWLFSQAGLVALSMCTAAPRRIPQTAQDTRVCVSKALHIKGGTKNPRVLVVELDRSDIVEMACRLAPAERSIQKTRGVAVRSPFSRPRRVKIHLRSL